MNTKYAPTGIIKEWFDMISQGEQPSKVRKLAYVEMQRLDAIANRNPQEESELMRVCGFILGISFCKDKPEEQG